MERLEQYLDVRDIAKQVIERGVSLEVGIDADDAGSSGPAHITLTDPDGNAILIDQFL